MKRWMLFLSCLFISAGVMFAQDTSISGTVVDDRGEEVIGASVVVKGTTIGTMTDIDGNFTISIPSGHNTLVVSLIGMTTQEVTASPNMKITMHSDAEILDEVMVVAYGTTTRSSFTGSAKAINADAISAGSKESLDKALVGKVSGVRVSSATGDPGSAGEINIRGVGSVNASKTPLYVIDGVPVKTDGDMNYYGKSQSLLSSINPEDIESMTILKDAAAASLYGSRAANGVVIITTKKGKEGKTKVSYNGELGWSNMAVKQYEMMSAKPMLEYTRDGLANFYTDNGITSNMDQAYAWANDGYYENGELAVPGMKHIFSDTSGNTNTDWWDEIYRTAFFQDHQVSVSSGSEATRIYASLGYNQTDGIVVGSDFERFSGRLNVDHKINNIFSIGLKQMITSTSQNGFRDQNDQAQGLGTSSPVGILSAMDPTATIKNPDGSYNANAGWGMVSNPNLMLGGRGKAQDWIQTKMFRSLSNVDLTAKISDKVTFKSVFGYDYMDNKHFEFWDPSGVNGSSVNGLGSRYTFENKTMTSSSTLRYSNTFANVHNFDVLGGYEAEKSELLGIYTVAQQYSTGKLPELSNGLPNEASSEILKDVMNSYLASANYNYNHKYYVSTSFRRDGSSRLGKDNRWANFWSASAAWRLSEESFLKGNRWFEDMKLKFSYGTNGNLPTDYYASLAMYSFSGRYGSNGGSFWEQEANGNLGWEKSNNLNIGLEWNIYGRVNFSIEYYNKLTKDLLFRTPTAATSGFAEKWVNLGELKNDGVEIEISSSNIKTKDFTWNTSFNLTYQQAKINKLPNSNADIAYGDGEMYIHRKGESIYSFYLPEWKGVNPETGMGEFWLDPDDHSKGITNFYSEAKKGIVGKALPDVIGGLTNTFTYKDFDLSFLITYQFGGDLFDYPGYFTHHDGVRFGNTGISKDVTNNYWRKPGDKVDNPKPIYGNGYRWDRFSSRQIKSTDNIRMREITFGYNIPSKLFKKYVSNARVYFRTNNPFMIWSKEDNIDPDVSLNGYRQVDTPQMRTFVFGLTFDI
ncbi:MAG: SusC/RagA family TonB-linked outer membrane protein [Dysgonomonas sp.]